MAEQPTTKATPPKPPVCVTGANGFIGSWIVKTLLENGYTTIHTSIFPGSDASHLFSLPGAAAASLIPHHSDLRDAAAVDRAVEGCAGGGVFHVASPCTLEDPVNPQAELVDPAVKGTLNVLAAAKKFGVGRVVLTSSISAMVPNPGWPGDRVFDESSWTDLDYCKLRQKWYPVSKTLAEKAAWDFANENAVDVVAIHPATCLGPLLQPGLNASCAVLKQLLEGSKDTQEYHWLGAVHVKDVAKAQLLLFETPMPRVDTSAPTVSISSVILQRKSRNSFLNFLFTGETQPGLVACKDAAKRLLDLGLKFTPLEDAVTDTVFSLRAKGFLPS